MKKKAQLMWNNLSKFIHYLKNLMNIHFKEKLFFKKLSLKWHKNQLLKKEKIMKVFVVVAVLWAHNIKLR